MSNNDMTSATANWRQCDGLSVTLVDGDAFIVNPENDAIFHLNALGRALWALLAHPQTVTELGQTVAEAFPDTPRATVMADTKTFIETLAKRGLIEAAD